MYYVGLTDDPEQRRKAHGNPPDWHQFPFSTEAAARAWEKAELAKPERMGGPGGAGWRFGYWYTVARTTVEQ